MRLCCTRGVNSGFRPATMATRGGGTCQRNQPAKSRRKNEATPLYTIPGIPMPCPPVTPPSPPRQGLKEKAKAACQKAGEMTEKAGKKVHQKISSCIPGNKDKNK